jgi:hypothetical protein
LLTDSLLCADNVISWRKSAKKDKVFPLKGKASINHTELGEGIERHGEEQDKG